MSEREAALETALSNTRIALTANVPGPDWKPVKEWLTIERYRIETAVKIIDDATPA